MWTEQDHRELKQAVHRVKHSARDPRVIPKALLSRARQDLKARLKQYEDEPLNHVMGPPSVSQPCPSIIPRNLEDRFCEIMEKEGIIVRHPWGGWMHPRFKDVKVPNKEDVKKAVIQKLDELDLRGGG